MLSGHSRTNLLSFIKTLSKPQRQLSSAVLLTAGIACFVTSKINLYQGAAFHFGFGRNTLLVRNNRFVGINIPFKRDVLPVLRRQIINLRKAHAG